MANYDINYDDSRFQAVESDKSAALNEVDKTYGDMIGQSDKYYQDQINASKDWADKQTQLQQEKTDFAIEKVEQNKAQAKKDYLKEQSGAYVDWQKQSNQYGAQAEQQASAGLTNTGFTESSQVSMYNTYQNRVATARESYNLAIQNYNNSITEARLQNNSVLAEIAYEALQKQLELSLQGFQYKNTLVLAKADKKTEVERDYYNRYQDVLKQINTENALAEEIRQFNAQMAFQREQFEWQKEQAEAAASRSYSRSYTPKTGDDTDGGKIDDSKNSNGTVNKTSSSSPPLNMDSVKAAGYGAQSGATIAKDVAAGKTTMTVKNGQTYVSKTPIHQQIAAQTNYSKFGWVLGK